MLKKFSVIIMALVFVGANFAQSRHVTNENMVKPNSNNKIVVSQQHQTNNPLDAGTAFINTGYDYACNNSIGPMIAVGPDIDGDGSADPIFTAMQRFDAAGQRKQMFGYFAFGITDAFSAFDETATTSGSDTYGWGTVQYCMGGALDGQAFLTTHSNGTSYHSMIDLVNLAPVTPFSTSAFGVNFPSFVYLSDGSILATSTDAIIYLSADQGATWDSVSNVGNGDANIASWGSASNSPAEYPIYKSQDDMNLSIVASGNAATTTNPDVVYVYSSNDGGGSWTGSIIGYGSGTTPEYGQISNRDVMAPYFDNFAQLEATVSNDGVTHVVINGYGEGVLPSSTPDTVNTFPILYWNTNNGRWMALTDISTENNSDGFGHYVSDPVSGARIYPGNGIGQAYPCVATSADGQVVFVAWEGFEYTGAVGASAWNIYPGDGSSETGEIYYTDLYYTYSEDGGQTFAAPGILKGDANVMEQFPQLARTIQIDGNQATVHYLYMEDAIPGIAVFNGQVAGQNSWSTDTKWLYDTMTFTLLTGVKGENNVVNSFELKQNYPNPFNPTTKISYSVANKSDVSLKVYDVLGKEVATLVNTTKDAGNYEVNFNASDLASGLYIYKLTAGNFVSTKKMMLLK